MASKRKRNSHKGGFYFNKGGDMNHTPRCEANTIYFDQHLEG